MTSSPPINLKNSINNASETNTFPSATFDYSLTTTYFESFLQDAQNNLLGLQYSFYSKVPSISLKQNSKLRDTNLYYSSRFAIVPKIHDIDLPNIGFYDLEMIIEHIPDQNNTSQNNLYTCILFNTDKKNASNTDAFETLFEGINTSNINASMSNANVNLNQSKIDNLKQSYMNVQLNSALIKNQSKDTTLSPDTYYYLDNSGNVIIVYNHPISISNEQYKILSNPKLFVRPVDNTTIFSNTDFSIKSKTSVVSMAFVFANNKKESFSTLKENFTSLREGMEKYVYCRPADSSNGNNLVTTTINTYANSTESSILLNDVTMIFVIMIVFIFMCVFSPVWFIYSNEKLLKFDIGYILLIVRILAFMFVFVGGIVTIIISRTVVSVPDWLYIVGLLMMICYLLFYGVVFFFQKKSIYFQLIDLMENETDNEKQTNIKNFTNYIFGPM
jgi:hypothetical protein